MASAVVDALARVRVGLEKATAAAGRATGPRLVAVSKLKSNEHIMAAFDAGHRHFGENYVQEFCTKAVELPPDIR